MEEEERRREEEEEEKEDSETKPVTDYLQSLYSKTVKSVHLHKTRKSRRNEEIMNLTIVKESLDSLYQKALKKSSANPITKQNPEKHNKSSQNASKTSQISSQRGQNSNEASLDLVKPDETKDIDFYLNVERMMNPMERIDTRGLHTLENLVFGSWIMKGKRDEGD